MSRPRVVTVIINYNTRDELSDCLHSLRGNLDRVVVYDANSTDGSAELVRTRYPEAKLVASKVNGGYGYGANRGVEACQSEYIIITNSDVLFEPDSLDKLEQYLDEHPEVGIAGPRLRNVDGTLQASCFPLPGSLQWLIDNDGVAPLLSWLPGMRWRLLRAWDHQSEREAPWVKGAVLAVRRTAFEQVKGFDESFFMYYEETDLCVRMSKAGWGVRFTPVTEVVHLGGASTSKVRGKMARELFIGSMRFAWHHYSWLHRTALLYFWRGILWIRTLRDRWRLTTCRDEAVRREIEQDLGAWKSARRWSFKDVNIRPF